MRYQTAVVASTALLLFGCATSPSERYFHLTAMAESPLITAGAHSAPTLRIAVGPVGVPDMVDRSQMVFDQGDGRVSVDEQNRWAEPLSPAIGRVVALDLGRMLGTPLVSAYPEAPWGEPQYRIRLDILRLEIRVGKEVTLAARWSVQGNAVPDTAPSEKDGSSLVSEQIEGGTSIAASVAAQDRALVRLSQDIAQAIEHLQSTQLDPRRPIYERGSTL